MKPRPLHGFTLIELLVVISIIALLISILLPTLRKARETAQGALCLANERSIGISASQYVNDNNGYFPRVFTNTELEADKDNANNWPNIKGPWHYYLWDYHRSWDVYLCPTFPDMVASTEFPSVWTRYTYSVPKFGSPTNSSGEPTKLASGYGYNNLLGGWPIQLHNVLAWGTWRADDVPTDVGMIGDSWARNPNTPPRSLSGINMVGALTFRSNADARHNQGVNVVFVDGHGEAVEEAEAWWIGAGGWWGPPKSVWIWQQ